MQLVCRIIINLKNYNNKNNDDYATNPLLVILQEQVLQLDGLIP
jgi:hypothetical protein